MRDLETDRLLIRALQADDLDDFSALMAGVFGGAVSRDACREQVAYGGLADVVNARLKQPPYGDRAVVLRAGGALVGLVGFVPCLAPFDQLPCFGRIPEARYTPEVGLFWATQPECRGKGYATEAAAAMVRLRVRGTTAPAAGRDDGMR